MSPPEETSPETGPPAPPKNLGGAKRRRGHRGGRGRGPRPPAKTVEARPLPSGEMNAPVESPVSAVAPADAAPAMPAKVIIPPRPRFQPVDQPARVPRTDGSAISQAVNEVMQVVESLKQTLEQMEEVLELVELAERQKLTDEREIESLIRALRQFQARGDRPERNEQPERQERFNRPERQNRPNRLERQNRPQRPEKNPGIQPPENFESSQPEPSENREPQLND
jgi:hypothetical protein